MIWSSLFADPRGFVQIPHPFFQFHSHAHGIFFHDYFCQWLMILPITFYKSILNVSPSLPIFVRRCCVSVSSLLDLPSSSVVMPCPYPCFFPLVVGRLLDGLTLTCFFLPHVPNDHENLALRSRITQSSFFKKLSSFLQYHLMQKLTSYDKESANLACMNITSSAL